jgi:hypothetical protein
MMRKLLDTLDFGPGIIVFDETHLIQMDELLEAQLGNLKEDLLQVTFPDNMILDLGCYGIYNNDQSPEFMVVVIKAHDWSAPKFLVRTRKINQLEAILQLALDYVLHNRYE